MRKMLFTFIAALLLGLSANAQQFVYYANTLIANTIPLQSTSSNFRQSIYYPSNFPTAPSGNITDIYIKTSTSTTINITNLTIKMGATTLSTFPSTSFITGLQTVYSGPYVQATVAGPYMKITLQTPFYYDNTQNFVLEISQTGYSTGVQIMQGSVGYTDRSIFGTVGNATGSLQARLAEFGFDISSNPCTNPVNPGISISDAATAVCPNTSVELDLNGHDVGLGITYEWEASPNNATGSYVSIGAAQSTPTLTVSPTSTTWYRCKVVCANGNPEYATPVQVDVNEVHVDLGNDTTYCEGKPSITLDAGNPGSTYLWSDNSTNQTLQVNTPGTYYVTVTSPFGCIGSDTIEVDYTALATGDYTATETTNGTILFEATGSGANQYLWHFGHNNATASGQSVSYTYPNNGFYNVTLNLVNDCNDTTKIIKSVTVTSVNVGISDLELESKIGVFPNPTKDFVVITNESGLTIQNIRIVSLLGQVVKSQSIATNALETTVDFQELSAGMYYLELQTSGGIIVRKISKQ